MIRRLYRKDFGRQYLAKLLKRVGLLNSILDRMKAGQILNVVDQGQHVQTVEPEFDTQALIRFLTNSTSRFPCSIPLLIPFLQPQGFAFFNPFFTGKFDNI